VKSDLEENIVDLISPVHGQMRTLDNDVIEILSSDDEFQVGILSDNVDMDFEAKTSLEECAATDWQDPCIVSWIVYNGEPIAVTQQLKVERIEVLEGLPSVWPKGHALGYLAKSTLPVPCEKCGCTLTWKLPIPYLLQG
jgi:hypothetical protein